MNLPIPRSELSMIPAGLRVGLLANMIWINASEIFRYFVLVMPMMRDRFAIVPDVAPMTLLIFLSWAVRDTLLVLTASVIIWLVLDRFGTSLRNTLLAGTLVWTTVFATFWLALMHRNLATWSIWLAALPLAGLEMVIAGVPDAVGNQA